jgi:hypothetical protein
MSYLIAIDSGRQLKYTGTLSGNYKEVLDFYSELEKIFITRGIKPPFHYSKLTRKQKILFRSRVIKIINNSNMKINVFFHKIPRGYSHKDYYLVHIPNCISENLESWIKSQRKDCDIELIVNEDYNIRNQKNGTNIFIENLIRQIGLRVTGKVVAIFDKTRQDKKIRATLKLLNGSIIDFYASKAQTRDSKEVQLIDIILGYYCDENKDFSRDRIHFRSI